MWTMDNTEGFTQSQLDMINEARAMVVAQADGVDSKNIDDAINNAWGEQDTAEALASDTLKTLGDDALTPSL